MENNNFDKKLKELLENYEAEYQPSDWDLMEEQIEAHSDLHPQLEDVLLDGVAYDSLYHLEEAYQPENWDLMREKLDASYALRRKLMKYKVAEVGLVLLFIFTLIRFLPFQKIQVQQFAKIEQSTEKQQHQSEIKTPSVADATVVIQTIDNDSDVRKNKTTNELTSSSPKQSTSNSSGSAIVIEDEVIIETTEQSARIALNDEPTETVVDIDETLLNKQTSISTDQGQADTESSEIGLSTTNVLNPILLREADKLIVPGIEEINSSKVFSDLKQPIKVRVGVIAGVDANYIMTPNARIDKSRFANFDRFAAGYSGGFTLGFQYSRLEIETGAIYSAVTYDPKNISTVRGGFTIGGYVEQGLKETQLDVIHIPLNLKYSFFTKKKWNVYVHSGASMNMVAKAFYNFTTNDTENSDGAARFLAENSRYPEENQKYNSNGIFEGGQLADNLFLTANLGFGVERYFTPRMSIFLQPNYRHQFSKGLGPQSERINSVSILTGAKVTLKKRKKSKR